LTRHPGNALRAHLRAHPRLTIALLVGLVVGLALGWLLPDSSTPVTRALIGWNVAVWLYLGLAGWTMWHADHQRLRRVALAQAETVHTVLAIVVVACVVSLIGVVVELSAAKLPGASHAWPHLTLAFATVTGSWLLLPTMFTLSYASRYYRVAPGGGLQFPGADAAFHPDYGDFLYFSFTIAVAGQTADVNVATSPMRRLVLLQALLSFAFNTAILALTINTVAGMF
jgi:uncharacterized membrane protein